MAHLYQADLQQHALETSDLRVHQCCVVSFCAEDISVSYEGNYLEKPDPMALMSDEVIDKFLSEQALAAFMKVNTRKRKTLINILSPKANRGSEVTQRVRRLAKLNRYLQKFAGQLSKALKL